MAESKKVFYLNLYDIGKYRRPIVRQEKSTNVKISNRINDIKTSFKLGRGKSRTSYMNL